jgi:hypothetical protein
LGIGAHGALGGGLEAGVGAQQLAAALAALSGAPAAAGAAEARLHLVTVVPQHDDGAQPRHDEQVVDEDDQRREDAKVLLVEGGASDKPAGLGGEGSSPWSRTGNNGDGPRGL